MQRMHGLRMTGSCCMLMEVFLWLQIMQGERGVVAHMKLPKDKELRGYDRLELDFALGCPGAQPHPLHIFSLVPEK